MKLSNQKFTKAFWAIILMNAVIGLGDLVVAFLFITKDLTLSVLQFIGLNFPIFYNFTFQISHFLENLIGHSYGLAIFYFLSHGFIKLFLVWALLKSKLWAYPLAIIFFTIFSVYQVEAYIRTKSIFELVLLGVNLLVLYMVSREYKIVKSKLVI